MLVFEAWENSTKELDVLFIPGPQNDFFCFIPPSLAAKYEFGCIEIGLTFLVKTIDKASQW